MSSGDGGDASGRGGGGTRTYGADGGGGGKGDAEAYGGPERYGTVEGGEPRGTKWVGEAGRCVRVVGEGEEVKDVVVPRDAPRPRSRLKLEVGESRGGDDDPCCGTGGGGGGGGSGCCGASGGGALEKSGWWRRRRDFEVEDPMEDGGEGGGDPAGKVACRAPPLPLIGTGADLGCISREGTSPSANAVDTGGKAADAGYGSSNSWLTRVCGASLDSGGGGGGGTGVADSGSSSMMAIPASADSPPPPAGTGAVGWRPSRRALEMSAALHLA